MSVYHVLGLMSGTSLDGLDMAYCVFTKREGQWTSKIVNALTVEYSKTWRNKLQESMHLSAEELRRLDTDYGKLLGQLAKRFMDSHHLKLDFIASHGHTVFHQPEKGYTLQIGNGPSLSAEAGVPVIYDFRSQDIALGGQGAPLVPVGDHLLFSDYTACINIGGFANISLLNEGNTRRAWDICPANFVLNIWAKKRGLDYDSEGQLARQGEVNTAVLEKLNNLSYYHQNAPKSLGAEWVNEVFLPSLPDMNTNDALATFTKHVAMQIAQSLPTKGKALFTGGGVRNSYLMKQIKSMCSAEVVIPNKLTIDFKEALIFAFLGVLRWNQETNIYSSVTGASRNHCAGSITHK